MAIEISILLADDHPVFRRGLGLMLAADPQIQIVGEAPDGTQALEKILALQPDIAILDVNMPGQTGFDVARTLQASDLATRIIFLTMHRDEDMFNEAIDLGAKGFVLKDSALSDIVDCLKAVASNSHYTSHSLTSFLVNRSRRAIGLAEKQPSINDLTPTERKVLKLIAENLTSKEIGEQLFISLRTVEKHRENICQKLSLQGSHSLFKFAVQNKSQLL